jgi:UPF0176 protein
MEQPYRVLLYYCYTPIEDPEAFRIQHHQYCADLGLRGRIVIAAEGINGTVSGLAPACETYMQHLKADPRFSQVDFKVDQHPQHAFQKLNVRVKPEIVHADLPHIKPHERTGQYVSPQELERIQAEENVILLDVRSNYEHQVGRFKNAITLDINHFREFKEQLPQLAPYKDKKIITYCTGGIKCEKASAYLLEQGFQNVYQLHGGIIKYGNETAGEAFEGKCYVFDNRLTTDINKKSPSTIGKCHICHTTCDRMVNCANPACNEHVPLCTACAKRLEGACSEACQKHPDKRDYNGTGYYTKKLNGYNPYHGVEPPKKRLIKRKDGRESWRIQ